MPEEFALPERIPLSLSSTRLTIRQYRLQDSTEYYELYSASFKDHLEPWSPVPALNLGAEEELRLARQHILAALEKWEYDEDYRFFIALRESGKIIGQLGLTQVMRNVNFSTTVGYWIGREHLNKGYATEALVLGLKFAFESLRLHRAALWISPENKPSLRVVEKLGLRFEGTAERALFLGGRWQDTHIFAITSEEWKVQGERLVHEFAP